MIKKILCILLAAAMTALSACAGDAESEATGAVDGFVPGITAEKAAELHGLTAASTENLTANGAVAAYFFNSHYTAFTSMEANSLKKAGFNENLPLGSQKMGEQDLLTYFLDSARTYLAHYMVMNESAAVNGVELTDAEIDALTARAERGVVGIYGENLDSADILEAMKLEALAAKLEAAKKTELTPDEDAMKSYAEENLSDYKYPTDATVNVRHILFSADTWGSKETALAKANEVMAAMGAYSADSFAALAMEYSDDAATCYNGGLYANLEKGSSVSGFDSWSFDAARKSGDIAVIETEFGAHIIYFEGAGLVKWQAEISDTIKDTNFDAICQLLYKTYPVTFNDTTFAAIAK